jgi:hypothetical protein
MPDAVALVQRLSATAWLVTAGLALAIVASVFLLLGSPRYKRRDTLFSKAELTCFRALERAVGEEYRIFAKVRLADVLTPEGRTRSRRWWRAFTKVSSKHLDYVLVDPQTSQIRLAVELDDRSHEKKRRKARDAFVNRVCAQAGVPLLRVPAAGRYGREELRARLAQAQVR